MLSAFALKRLTLVSAAALSANLVPPVYATELPSGYAIGSTNVAIADPAVPRPTTQPCTVTLFSNMAFTDFSSHGYSYTPPAACPMPWSKVVLEVDLSVNAGRQFDRTAHIWLGGANIFTGTTQEPSASEGPNWHVERDISDYAALFANPQPGSVDLGNLINSQYTGVLQGTATLQIYPAAPNITPPRVPDIVYPLSASATGGAVTLNTPSDQLSQTFTFPPNVERVFVDVLAQGQSGDEFWYTCVPNNLSTQLQSCGSTAFRETEISIDGQPAGVAPVYPWIFTGGIDPLLWRPTPGVQTLNLLPYRVDLSPFAGVLSNGQPHQISLSVANANSYFLASGAVLIYRDPKSSQVNGAITQNTLVPVAAPTITNQLSTDSQGNISGTLLTSSARDYLISGYIQTAHGRIDTTVHQKMSYQNTQAFTINASNYVQNITQRTDVETGVTITGGGSVAREHHQVSYPLTMNIASAGASGQPSTQTTAVNQAFDSFNAFELDGWPIYASEAHNEVSPADLLQFDASGAPTGNTGQKSVQRYRFVDSLGNCYKRSITSLSGVLTAVTDGDYCPGSQNYLSSIVDPYGLALPEVSTLNLYR